MNEIVIASAIDCLLKKITGESNCPAGNILALSKIIAPLVSGRDKGEIEKIANQMRGLSMDEVAQAFFQIAQNKTEQIFPGFIFDSAGQ